jgi:hypothetical protein
LVVAAKSEEGVDEPEVTGDHFEWVAGLFGCGDSAVGGDPGGVRLVLPCEGGCGGLIGAGAAVSMARCSR